MFGKTSRAAACRHANTECMNAALGYRQPMHFYMPAQEKQPKLKPKPLPGAGSPLNLFRVLVPGWLESRCDSRS